MIIMQLVGGLGNQLFQYALGRTLSISHNVPLGLDCSAYEADTLRTYRLGYFDIKAREIDHESLDCLLRRGAKGKWACILSLLLKRLPISQHREFYEQQHNFDPRVFNMGGNLYLRGYWQTEKYFRGIASILREEIIVKSPPNAENRAVSEQINQTNSVSLHVRRGDYVANPHTQSYHGVCSLEYYQAAIETLLNHIHNPHFFIFSDDMQWVSKYLHLTHPTTYVAHNGAAEDYEDLRLMSQCKYHIIANSSFSWWGAWLSTWPDKMVIAPNRWFENSTRNTQDVLPKSWIRLGIK
jgi:hypothetical protein